MVKQNSGNRRHKEDDLPTHEYDRKKIREKMSESYLELLKEVESKPQGRKALKKYSQFWKLPFPTEIDILDGAPGKDVVLVGAGNTTGVYLADGPSKNKSSRSWDVKKKGKIAFDVDGRKIFIINGKGNQNLFGKDLKFVGFARETHYIPTKDMEDAGTFKSGKYWVHAHDDNGGKFPKVFKDAAGNYMYAPGTMRVDEWLRR